MSKLYTWALLAALTLSSQAFGAHIYVLTDFKEQKVELVLMKIDSSTSNGTFLRLYSSEQGEFPICTLDVGSIGAALAMKEEIRTLSKYDDAGFGKAYCIKNRGSDDSLQFNYKLK